MNDTRAAPSAGSVDVEEHHTIAFAQCRPVERTQRTSHELQHARGHMTGNDGIWHSAQTSVPEMHVRTAHFGPLSAQQRRTFGKIRNGELAQLDRLARRRHDGSKDAIVHSGTLPLIQLRFHLP